ncbi:MAG: TVP38/TMEM64 family protein [Geminicoccaceae bacterium]
MIKLILASIVFVGVVLAALIYVDAQDQVLALLTWIDDQGLVGPLFLMIIMALIVVLLLPGVMFTTGAGFAFGVIEGSIVVVLGTTFGATGAFLLARYGLGARAEAWVQRHARLKAMSNRFAADGWKIVLLTRLVPFFPFKLSNYVFGMTRISLRGFVGGTLIGEIPLSVHNVYLGSLAADLVTLGQRPVERTLWEWTFYGAGLVLAVLTVIYVSHWARQVLSGYESETLEKDGGDALA